MVFELQIIPIRVLCMPCLLLRFSLIEGIGKEYLEEIIEISFLNSSDKV